MAPFLLHGRLLLFFFSLAAVIFLFCPLRSSAISIHDLLKSQGLPAGLFPKEVKNYTLSEDGLLEVFLDGPCLTKFDTMAFYESVVRANLSHGGLTGVQGFSQEELFVWLPVKGVIVDDPSSGLIFIDIGLAHKQLSLSLFEDPPDCKNDATLASQSAMVLESLGTYSIMTSQSFRSHSLQSSTILAHGPNGVGPIVSQSTACWESLSTKVTGVLEEAGEEGRLEDA